MEDSEDPHRVRDWISNRQHVFATGYLDGYRSRYISSVDYQVSDQAKKRYFKAWKLGYADAVRNGALDEGDDEGS